MRMDTFLELPQVEPEVVERADAARNRERILCEAARLFSERGAGCVSMEEVADAAGVGKGTLFRRFGSRAALARAVLSERERGFQERIIRGEPPLGPGVPPLQRLVAFGHAVLENLDSDAELALAGEVGGARFAAPPYAVYRLHMTLLLREVDPRCDAELLAESLLAALGADFFLYMRDLREMPLERLKAGWETLVRGTVGAASGASAASASGNDLHAKQVGGR
jgi:AcrR family transcriptional regulator